MLFSVIETISVQWPKRKEKPRFLRWRFPLARARKVWPLVNHSRTREGCCERPHRAAISNVNRGNRLFASGAFLAAARPADRSLEQKASAGYADVSERRHLCAWVGLARWCQWRLIRNTQLLIRDPPFVSPLCRWNGGQNALCTCFSAASPLSQRHIHQRKVCIRPDSWLPLTTMAMTLFLFLLPRKTTPRRSPSRTWRSSISRATWSREG